jgi:F-type H+-transporting ATPase subunit b
METIVKSLAFDVTIFFAQMALFIVLWIVMSKLFWNPYLAHILGRDKSIKDAYHQVEAMNAEMVQLRDDYQARIADIEADARARIQNAIKEAQHERERIIAESRAASEAAIKQGIAEMDAEKTQAMRDMQQRIVGMALGAAGKALGNAANSTTLRSAIEQRIARN